MTCRKGSINVRKGGVVGYGNVLTKVIDRCNVVPDVQYLSMQVLNY
jgi:hypothetical protein